jgi:ferrous iron transport protein B
MTGCPVVQISASKGTASKPCWRKSSVRWIKKASDEPLSPTSSNATSPPSSKTTIFTRFPREADALGGHQVLEADELFLASMPQPPQAFQTYIEQARKELVKHYDDDVQAIIIDQRYK